MKTKREIIIVLVLLSGLLLAGVVLAAPNATSLDRYVIGGGGGHAEGGIYMLEGTIGQPVVGGISSAPYELGAGFWGGLGAAGGAVYGIYLPLIVRSDSP
jgi:hypothetical protein